MNTNFPTKTGYRVVLRTDGDATVPSFSNGEHFTVYNKLGPKEFTWSWVAGHRLVIKNIETNPDGSGQIKFKLEEVQA